MPREFSRHQRLGHQVQRTLAELLQFEVKDPRVQNVSLTSVDLSRDLSVARVYFSLLDPDADAAEALEGLERASGFLRGKLGRAIKVRHVPELRFVHDDSAAEAVRLAELIDRAVAADDREDVESGPAAGEAAAECPQGRSYGQPRSGSDRHAAIVLWGGD
jgi:ribosome-binding factor A